MKRKQWPPKDMTVIDCAPKPTLCTYCMDAAYAHYWAQKAGAAKATCETYIPGARTLCEKVADAVKSDLGSDSAKLKVYYDAYGPYFGATAAYCRLAKCCNGDALT